MLSIFIIKIIAGFAFALFYKLPQYYATADTWRFYHLSLTETDWLLNDPLSFIKDLFSYGYDETGNIFSGSNSYWNDLKSNVLVKLIAVLNVITNKSYYTLIIFFNYFFLLGLVGLYRVFTVYSSNRKVLLLIGIFFIPSTLFWCSGVHKDGFILSFTGLIIFFFSKVLNNKKYNLKAWIIIVTSLVVIFSLRNYVAFILIPALFCWWYSNKLPKATPWIFTLVYLMGIFLFFFLPTLVPTLNFPFFLANKQQEFLALSGGSAIYTNALQPNAFSFFKYLPTAIDMAFLRPHLTEGKGIAALLAFFETASAIIIFITYLIFPFKLKIPNPFFWFLIIFGLSILIIAGYTITFSGAIVRYRSFILPFIITPLLLMIDYCKIKSYFVL